MAALTFALVGRILAASKRGIALVLDAKTGIVYAPEITSFSVTVGEILAKVFLKTIPA